MSLIVLLSLLCYRVTRFIILDTLLEGARMKFQIWLIDHNRMWTDKLYELSTCPYCVSIYVAAAAVATSEHYLDIPLPVFTWLAVSGGAMVVWRFVEHPAETVKVKPADPEDD